jgi:hypothetical protein
MCDGRVVVRLEFTVAPSRGHPGCLGVSVEDGMLIEDAADVGARQCLGGRVHAPHRMAALKRWQAHVAALVTAQPAAEVVTLAERRRA